jgi:hypothetical protein
MLTKAEGVVAPANEKWLNATSNAIELCSPQKREIAAQQQSTKQTRLAVFTPVNLTEAIALSKMMASSDIVPKEYKGKAANILIVMQFGAEIGLPPLQALQCVAVINGRPCLYGDGALALVQSHPDYEAHKEWIEGSGDTRRAVCQVKRRGQEWHQQTFSVQDAKVAKLWGKRGYNGQDTPWITNPDRMLAMRARGFALRDRFADALKGMRLAEEAMDIPEKPTRESGTLDVNREMATLTASAEPNRGHGQEGFAQAPALSQPAGMDQTAKAQEETICGDCHEKNGNHKPDCFYATPPDPKAKCGECNAIGGHLPKCSKRKQASAAAQPAQDAPKAPETEKAPEHNWKLLYAKAK